MSAWYYVEDGERRGPVDAQLLAELLRSGQLAPDTLVWQDGMTDWAPARSMPGLLRAESSPTPDQPAYTAEPAFPVRPERYAAAAAPVTYAGFWKRFLAWFLDRILLTIAGGCFGGIAGGIFGVIATARGVDVNDPSFEIGAQIIGGVIGTIIGWLYYALLESSQYQATPGKMIVQIRVTDLDGGRISFGRATGRYFGKIISGLILLIGFMMAGWTEKKQALHDILAGCLVVNK